MSDMTEKATREEEAPEDLGTEGAEGTDERVDASADEAPAEPETELERLTRERDEYLKSWQRAQADFQNQKRRTIADIDAALRRSQSVLLEEILLVLDHLDMALMSPCESQDAKNLQIGVQMTRDQLLAALKRQDVAAIPVEGAFDPAVHQAIATIESEEHEPGQILEVVRSGWMHKDLVLRFAQVKVAALPDDSASEDGATDAD